jgi:hypothetical protein
VKLGTAGCAGTGRRSRLAWFPPDADAGAPPKPERGVSIADVYVHAGGERLRELAGLLARRELEAPIDAAHPLAQAADALALVPYPAGAARTNSGRGERMTSPGGGNPDWAPRVGLARTRTG